MGRIQRGDFDMASVKAAEPALKPALVESGLSEGIKVGVGPKKDTAPVMARPDRDLGR
jgi:hypothetical protein